MFCEYDLDVYRNYKLGKMIKMFYEERVKNYNLRHPKNYTQKVETKTLNQSVKDQLKDKNAQELWEELIEKQKEKMKEMKKEKERLQE